MDPNETLRKILELVERIVVDATDSDTAAFLLAKSIGDLDIWIQKGGALPTRWRQPPNTHEQIFIVRAYTSDGAAVELGRYYDYAHALEHATRLKEHEEVCSRLDIANVSVNPAEVLP